MEFSKLVEKVLQENTSKQAFKKSSNGHGILGGIVTDTGKFYSAKPHSSDRPGDHWGHDRASHVNYGDHLPSDDMTQPRPHQNKMGKQTRGNSLRSGKTNNNTKSKNVKKR